MLQTILLVVMILISLALTGVVLLQRSEGGALGMGGGPSGFMSASGAGNLLTVATWWLGGAFFACAIALTITGNMARSNQSIVDPDAVGALAAPAAGETDQPAAQTPAPTQAPSLKDIESNLTGASPAPAVQPAPKE